jgi:hypothetical protein
MKARWLLIPALFIAAVVAVCVFDRAVLHFLGWDGQTSDNYAAWSGSVPAIATILGMSTVVGTLWRNINCRAPGCARLGHYHDSRGVKWCWRHHPDHDGQKPTLEMLHRLHFEHRNRTAKDGQRA